MTIENVVSEKIVIIRRDKTRNPQRAKSDCKRKKIAVVICIAAMSNPDPAGIRGRRRVRTEYSQSESVVASAPASTNRISDHRQRSRIL